MRFVGLQILGISGNETINHGSHHWQDGMSRRTHSSGFNFDLGGETGERAWNRNGGQHYPFHDVATTIHYQ